MLTVKEKVLEIVEIAKQCPENLQAICFELLLRDHLEAVRPKPEQPAEAPAPDLRRERERDWEALSELAAVSSPDDRLSPTFWGGPRP